MLTKELAHKYIESNYPEYKDLKISNIEDLAEAHKSGILLCFNFVAHAEYRDSVGNKKNLFFGIIAHKYNEWYSKFRNNKIDEILNKK
jgi:hypothetical protein